jgi:hypothetical protein
MVKAANLELLNDRLVERLDKLREIEEEFLRLKELEQTVRIILGDHRYADRHTDAAEDSLDYLFYDQLYRETCEPLGRAIDSLEVVIEKQNIFGLPFLHRERIDWSCIPSIWPVRKGLVTTEFYRSDDSSEGHLGIDIAATEGNPVFSTARGMVRSVRYDEHLGHCIEIDHGYGIVTRYGHNSECIVDEGENVVKGQKIALIGNSGRSSAPHLHYEVMVADSPIDPRQFFLE